MYTQGITTQSRASGPDFSVTTNGYGTVWLFTPENEAARLFCDHSLPLEDWQWLGAQFAVDWRPGRDLVSSLLNEGFFVHVDGVEVELK